MHKFGAIKPAMHKDNLNNREYLQSKKKGYSFQAVLSPINIVSKEEIIDISESHLYKIYKGKKSNASYIQN